MPLAAASPTQGTRYTINPSPTFALDGTDFGFVFRFDKVSYKAKLKQTFYGNKIIAGSSVVKDDANEEGQYTVRFKSSATTFDTTGLQMLGT